MVALCENCRRRPAKFVWILEDGSDSLACGECGRPGSGVELREIGSDEGAREAASETPLTVAKAAEREQVSTRTIHRWLPMLAADGGAWQTNGETGEWRIAPAALDRRRVESSRPGRRAKASTRRPARARKKQAATDEMGWPAK